MPVRWYPDTKPTRLADGFGCADHPICPAGKIHPNYMVPPFSYGNSAFIQLISIIAFAQDVHKEGRIDLWQIFWIIAVIYEAAAGVSVDFQIFSTVLFELDCSEMELLLAATGNGWRVYGTLVKVFLSKDS